QAKYELGVIAWDVLCQIKGGSGEGTNCYTTQLIGCHPSLSDQDVCHVFTSNSPSCSIPGKIYGNYPKKAFREKESIDPPNTLARKPVLEKCFNYVNYVETIHYGTVLGGGWDCDSGNGCEQSFFNWSTNNCIDCELSGAAVPGPSVESATCRDP
ncbi:MAG: hypothetical protein LBF88_08405, partial [Planctomycetaceae bacterium]|nr:hypothetical protein [Planctomycetaceae bacterium]